MGEVQWTGVRLWTSAAQLGQKELCSILAEMNREDKIHWLVSGGATVMRAINSVVVDRKGDSARFPRSWDHKSHRAAGIPRKILQFWKKLLGRKYRAPAPLATSISLAVMQRFLTRINCDLLDPVHFLFLWPDETP